MVAWVTQAFFLLRPKPARWFGRLLTVCSIAQGPCCTGGAVKSCGQPAVSSPSNREVSFAASHRRASPFCPVNPSFLVLKQEVGGKLKFHVCHLVQLDQNEVSFETQLHIPLHHWPGILSAMPKAGAVVRSFAHGLLYCSKSLLHWWCCEVLWSAGCELPFRQGG